MARRGLNIYKRKDGRYEGRYIKTHDATGKALYGYVYAKSYADVREKLAKCSSSKLKNRSYSDMHLSEWLAIWVENNNWKQSTKELYRRHIINHINPKLGKLPLKKINTEIIQNFIFSLQLAPATVRLIYTVLKTALKSAEEKGYVKDIWLKVKLPQKAKAEVMVLTPQEQRKLERALSDSNDIGILICLYMGLRIGEICALKWNDIDLKNQVIQIKGTQIRMNGELKITAPKSRASERTIPIPNILLGPLKSHKRDGEYVLSHNGEMVEVRTYRRRFKKLLQIADLPDIKFHALRHTFSTRALEVGMDYKTLSEILGHASVAITMDLYVHSLDEHKKRQINKLNQIFDSASN